MNDRVLIVITGPTGSGKTALSIELARELGCHIVSADSRQLFRGLEIGTAAPSQDELAAAPHHFIGCLSPADYYSAAQFEQDALSLMDRLWADNRYIIMCGGSMMYVDAVCNGIDTLPTVSEANRRRAYDIYDRGGIEAIRAELRRLDPDYADTVDPHNHKRIIHAVEVSLEAGVPYSTLLTGKKKKRPFTIIKAAIDMPRQQLFERINRRVDSMIANGLEEEARRLYPMRHLNSLNTVGYKELFAMFDGTMDREIAIARIAKNTRVYAKKQLTWLKRDSTIHWLDPSQPLLPQLRSHLPSNSI